MKFPSMLRRLRNTQAGMRSTRSSPSTPYPYRPIPPPPPPVVDTSRPLTTIHVPPQADVTRGEPFDITVEFSETGHWL